MSKPSLILRLETWFVIVTALYWAAFWKGFEHQAVEWLAYFTPIRPENASELLLIFAPFLKIIETLGEGVLEPLGYILILTPALIVMYFVERVLEWFYLPAILRIIVNLAVLFALTLGTMLLLG